MDNSILKIIILVLAILAGSSGFFGKNLPKAVWWTSIIAAGLLGFVIVVPFAPFPENLFFGTCVSAGAILLVLILRIPRRNHPK